VAGDVRRRFFDELTETGQFTVRAAGSLRRAAAGEVLCLEGAPLDVVFVVTRGLVSITKTALHGRQVLLELRGPGELIGELSVLDGQNRSAMMTVVEAAELLVIPAGALSDLLRTDAPIAHALLVTLAARLRQSAERHLELGTSEALARVARRLLELWELRGRAADVVSPLSQQDLADWAGVSRDGVVRALATLRADGVVDTGRRRYTIHDPVRLHAYFG
jgi:CRP/FNR family transcriptional regulator, cyclic AMP receptor protein